jgi:hypothetical protein
MHAVTPYGARRRARKLGVLLDRPHSVSSRLPKVPLKEGHVPIKPLASPDGRAFAQ